MEYGEKIATLRKANGMTQAELGNALNVTFQAVSKWERGESFPDFETMSKIAKLFGVPITYFEDGIIPEPESTVPEPSPVPVMYGVCTVCGKGIYDREEIGELSPVLKCKDCCNRAAANKKALEDKAKKDIFIKQRREKQQAKHMRDKGLIAGGIVSALILIIAIIGIALSPQDVGYAILGTAVLLIFLFTFISQLFWHGVIVDVIFCGGKVIGGPGVIFTLDLSGIIFLIGVKLLFWLIKVIFFIITVIFFAAVAILISPFTFVPALIKLNRGQLPD